MPATKCVAFSGRNEVRHGNLGRWEPVEAWCPECGANRAIFLFPERTACVHETPKARYEPPKSKAEIKRFRSAQRRKK